MSLVETKVALNFLEIRARLERLELSAVDLIIGAATSGNVPANLIEYKPYRPLVIMQLNYRAEDSTPQRPEPLLLTPFHAPTAQRVLRVDDISVIDKTLAAAKALLTRCSVITLVMTGQVNIVLFPKVASCVVWPWKVS